jgi:hypothetical protein
VTAELSLVLAWLLSAAAAQPQDQALQVREARDQTGRVQSRLELRADGSLHSAAHEYWPDSGVTRRTRDVERDRHGRTTGQLLQEFDERGRLLERIELTYDAVGRPVGQRTRYSYAADGRRIETSGPFVR